MSVFNNFIRTRNVGRSVCYQPVNLDLISVSLLVYISRTGSRPPMSALQLFFVQPLQCSVAQSICSPAFRQFTAPLLITYLIPIYVQLKHFPLLNCYFFAEKMNFKLRLRSTLFNTL